MNSNYIDWILADHFIRQHEPFWKTSISSCEQFDKVLKKMKVDYENETIRGR